MPFLALAWPALAWPALAWPALAWLALAWLAPASLALAGSLAVSGCESRVSLGARCTERSDCTAPLACVGGRCREECDGPAQCASGQRCIAGPSGARACTLAPEESCSSTDPCDPTLFAACREGRCVTGCTDGSSCVSGACDTTMAVGVCVEPISSGQDAGPVDAWTGDAGPAGCLGVRPAASTRSLADAVLGGGAASAPDETSLWLEELGAPSLVLTEGAGALGLAVHAGGAAGPRLLGVVSLGSRAMGRELAVRRAQLFDGTVETGAELDSGFDFGAMAARSGADEASVALLRPRPSAVSGDGNFVWIVRESAGLVNLAASPTPPTFLGALGLFGGPDVDFAREVLVVDELRAGAHTLEFVGTPFGEGNSVSIDATAAGTAPFEIAAAEGAVLLHQPAGQTLLARCVGASGAAPRVTIARLDGVVTDATPALLATADASSYRAVLRSGACGELPIASIACTGSDCTLAPPVVALDGAGAEQVEAVGWGEGSALMVRTASGASVTVLDADGAVVGTPLSLGASETHELETLTLREARVAASVSGGVAVLVVGGLYTDGGTAARVLVRALRLAP